MIFSVGVKISDIMAARIFGDACLITELNSLSKRERIESLNLFFEI